MNRTTIWTNWNMNRTQPLTELNPTYHRTSHQMDTNIMTENFREIESTVDWPLAKKYETLATSVNLELNYTHTPSVHVVQSRAPIDRFLRSFPRKKEPFSVKQIPEIYHFCFLQAKRSVVGLMQLPLQITKSSIDSYLLFAMFPSCRSWRIH